MRTSANSPQRATLLLSRLRAAERTMLRVVWAAAFSVVVLLMLWKDGAFFPATQSKTTFSHDAPGDAFTRRGQPLLFLGAFASSAACEADACGKGWRHTSTITAAVSAALATEVEKDFVCKPVVHYEGPLIDSAREGRPQHLGEVYGYRRAQRRLEKMKTLDEDPENSESATLADNSTMVSRGQSRGARLYRSPCCGLGRRRLVLTSASSLSSSTHASVNASLLSSNRSHSRREHIAWSTSANRAGRTSGNIKSNIARLQMRTTAYTSGTSSVTSSLPVYTNRGADDDRRAVAPVILLIEPSGAIGFGATLSSLLLFGIFDVILTGVYVDGVLIPDTDILRESDFAIRLTHIPASPAHSGSSLLLFGGAKTLNESADQDCDNLTTSPVNITFAYAANDDSDSGGGDDRPVNSTTVLLDGEDGRPLLMRQCTLTPLLLSLSTSVRVMEPWAAPFLAKRENTAWGSSQPTASAPFVVQDDPSTFARAPQHLTFITHPQRKRIPGHPQQDWEAGMRRFSVQTAPFTYSDVDIEAGLPLTANSVLRESASWWNTHTAQAVSRVAAKDSMFSNVSVLWSVGEITGDLTTATVLHSLDAQPESYSLYVVLPSLTHVAHTVTLPTVYGVAPESRVWFWNQNWMVTTTNYDVSIKGALPRSTLFVNLDTWISLRPLRVPALRDGDWYASVTTMVDDCEVAGAGHGDSLHCRVAVTNDVYNASGDADSLLPTLMDTCGGGVVVDLFLAHNITSADAASAVVNWDANDAGAAVNVTAVAGFPISVAANSVLRLESILAGVPHARQLVRSAAAAVADTLVSESSADGGGDWVALRFSFIYQNRRSGVYRVHCDGSAEDMHVSIRANGDPLTAVDAHCIQSATLSESVFRHATLETVFDSQSALYVNASCTFRLNTVLDADAASAAFCGVSLEGIDVDFVGEDNTLLPSYDVYELRIPMSNTVELRDAQQPTYQAILSADGAQLPISVLNLPSVTSDQDCYGIPWRVVESAAAHAGSAPYGQRWGGLGYEHQSFPVTAKSGARYCHAFVAFFLPGDAASLCPQLGLTLRDARTAAEDYGDDGVLLAQRVFCGSRSHFMDPISALQLRVPLVDIPRMVDLDALIPDTEMGYLIYQYCIDVQFYLTDMDGFTGAYAQNGPLVFTLLDTVDTPSSFVPWVRQTVGGATTPLVLGETLYLIGESLRYYDSTGTHPLTGTRFSVHLAEVDVQACGDYFLVVPSGFYPTLPAHWINESAIALPITADVPGGWFNFTLTQGETGEAYVNCGLSLRVAGTVTSVTTTDVAGPAGGTTVHIRGANLPMATMNSNVTVMIGYTNGNAQLKARRCTITFSLGTMIACTTPTMSAEDIAQLALFTEESTFASTHWLPLNLTVHYYNATSGIWDVFQSINVDTVAGGAELLSVKFRVSKMTVTNVWPLDVSRMEGNPTFHITGTGIESHSVLLCDVSTITAGGVPETTSCILCLPRSFSSVELVCDALWPLNESAYRVYVSDIALEGDTGFIVHTHLSVTAVKPAFLYPYSEGVQLSIEGEWFAEAVATDMLLVAKTSGGTEQRQYHVPFLQFTDTIIVAKAPDLSWMAEAGGTLFLHVLYGLDLNNPDDVCERCTVEVVAKAMMPSIDSVSPFIGQAPLLIHVYGSGFTKLYHSPKTPLSLLTSVSPGQEGAQLLPVQFTGEEQEETYISIGIEPCRIVDMLNTLIVCNLTTPCANLDSDNPVRLVSQSYGSTATSAVATSSKLFFYCTMSLTGISPSYGSTEGGQELTVLGTGFPPNVFQTTVTVAGIPCVVMEATKTAIVCITSAAPARRVTTGSVLVSSSANGRETVCCVYTYDPSITPTITSVSPVTAAAGAQLLLFGTNFPGMITALDASGQPGKKATMELLFGQHSLEITEVRSPTSASVTIPEEFFGRDYIAVRVPGVGNSARFLEQEVTILMTPSTVVPSSSGFRGRIPIQLIGTHMSTDRSTWAASPVFEIYVCGRFCEMLDASDNGEARCRAPTYMDEEMVAQYRASLQFPNLTSGFWVHLSTTATTDATTMLRTASPLLNSSWTDVSSFFQVNQSLSEGVTVSAFSSVSIASPELSILLEAQLHSRLLFYNVMLFFSPVAINSSEIDLSNATCRLSLSTAEAETADLFSPDASPGNASMWQTYSNGDGSHFTWPALQIGANALNFNALDTLPTAAYARIACEGLPVNALRLTDLRVSGYQVGLDAAGGRCPVSMRAKRRGDEYGMNSCPSRTGESCPIFYYRTSLTPVVTRYEPPYVLANDVDARVTLHGSGFGSDVSAVQSVLLDKAECTPVSVTDGELVCAMKGRVSRDGEWAVLWTDESSRGEAFLLSAQPFYAAIAWSSYLAWRGEGLPVEGQIVVIPRYNSILLDTTPPALTGMLLYGVLIISDNLDIELRLGLLAVSETGALIAGSAEHPHRHKFTITLATNFFQDLPLYYLDDIYSISQQTEPYLDKTLEVQGGTLQLHGVPPTVPKARLAVTANPGDSVVTVDRWVPWSVGDSVALVTKDDHNPHHVERRVLTGRVANATHTVLHFSSDTPLAFLHSGKHDQSASQCGGGGGGLSASWVEKSQKAQTYEASTGTDVVYLTRTICIRGDAISSISAIGASLWLTNTTTSQLSHVEMYRTGKRGSKLSYSVWLQGISFPADRVVLDDVVIYDAFNRGVVLQETRHVVVTQVTVVSADGFGIATIGAGDERVTVQNSSLFGMYADSGGIDTVSAGMFISSADVALRDSEVCVSDGHGVWFALRFLFLSANARTCPGQCALADFEANRIHHTGGHGLVIYPLHFNAGDRCRLSVNTAAANDPEEVNSAEMTASIDFEAGLQPAGTLHDQLIFSCGLHGIYLPPSSGYVLSDVAVMDCARASLFIDYATNKTVIRQAFVSASLPDGNCTTGESISRATTDAVKNGCGTVNQTGIQAQHGGHLSLFSFAVGDFRNGSALSLGTLSVPSSQATSYPSGSLSALRSARLTIRLFNFSVVGEVNVRVELSGEVAMMDVDGQLSKSNVSSFIFFGGPTFSKRLPNCRTVPAASVDTSLDAADLEASTRGPRPFELDREAVMNKESPITLSWAPGREEEVVSVSGRVLVRLARPESVISNNPPSLSQSSSSFSEGLSASSGSDTNGNGARAPSLTMCVAPTKQLSLLFVHVLRVDAWTEGGAASRCAAVTAELQEHDNSSFRLFAEMSALPVSSEPVAASATAFYILTRDDRTLQSGGEIGSLGSTDAYASWHAAVPTNATVWGRAGFYSLASNANITLAFRTLAGAICYPASLSLSVDPSLAWPTAELMVRARVSPAASYFDRQSSLHSACASSRIVGSITWIDDPISDAMQGQYPEKYSGESHAADSHSLPSNFSPATSTVMINLAQNSACLNTSTIAANNVAATSASGTWTSAPPNWAAVEIASCKGGEDSDGAGCMGPFFPYLRKWAESNRTGGEGQSGAPSSYVSWYSAAAWCSGLAPWNVNLNEGQLDSEFDSYPVWYNDAYIIPFGTRVNLTLTEAVQVSGVLVVVGELFITTAAAVASAEAAASVESAAGDAIYEVSISTLIVLGKLNVSVRDASAPRVRIVLGADSVSREPFRLDVDTLVYPGTLYAAGEVALTGATTAPTTWKTHAMVRGNTTEFPACTSLTDFKYVEDWCGWQARWAVAKALLDGNASGVATNPAVNFVLSSLQSSGEHCMMVMLGILPEWMQWTSSTLGQPLEGDSFVGWRRGERVGLTSGSSSLYNAEERVLARDIEGSRVSVELIDNESIVSASCSTERIDSGAVTKRWMWPHGRDYARDTTERLLGFGIDGEAVALSKTIELDCDIPRSASGSGCAIIITRQQHPNDVFAAPVFRASGVSVRHFGKGGQLRENATPARGVEPLTFLPAIYVNVSSGSERSAADGNLTNCRGYAALVGSVVEDSYGTALYTTQQSTRLFMVDSAIWYSEGGGMRLDGGGPGIFIEGVVVAGTRYTRTASTAASSDTGTERMQSSSEFGYEKLALTLVDTAVTSMCSVLLNHSHVIIPGLGFPGDDSLFEEFETVSTVGGAFIKNTVAGGSESEGFCLPWASSGGGYMISNNTAHSSYVGLFLFRTSPKAATESPVAFIPWCSLRTDCSGFACLGISLPLLTGKIEVDAATEEIFFRISLEESWFGSFSGNNATTFKHWVVYDNRYIGVYSSAHQKVTIAESDIFANPIGVALAIHPDESFGSSSVVDSYIATFPRCSCTAAMYGFTSFTHGDDAFWQVCQPSAYAEPAWTPQGCGAVTFIDGGYHYAAVLALPSYEYVPLSYSRSAVFTAPSSDALESVTEGSLLLDGVLFGAVGDLNLCESSACDPATMLTTGRPLRSAAVMGTAGRGMRSSASLSPIEMRRIRYAPSSAPALLRPSSSPESKIQSNLDGDENDATSNAATLNGAVREISGESSASIYRPLAGTPASVLRLRPTAPITATSPAGQVLAEQKERIRAFCADGNRCIASDAAAVNTLREGYENPYAMTAVYDADGTVYGALGSEQIYIPRGASLKTPAPPLFLSMCKLPSFINGEMFACPSSSAFCQVRLHSADDRVSRGVAVPILFTQTSLFVVASVELDSESDSVVAVASSAAVLQPPEDTRTGATPSTVEEAVLTSSASQLAFLVPQGNAVIKIDPSSYPESMELRTAACTSLLGADNGTTQVVLPLLNDDVSVRVWRVSTRTLVERLQSDPVTIAVSTTGKPQVTDSAGFLSPVRGVLRVGAIEDIMWMTTTSQNNDNGVTASSLFFQLACGASVRIHQLVYATLLLYTTGNADAVAQRVLRFGAGLTVEQLLPPERYPSVNASVYANRLRITLSDIEPDPNTGTGISLTIKIEALDSFDYNITAATILVNEFSKLFSAAYGVGGYKSALVHATESAGSGSQTGPRGGVPESVNWRYSTLTIAGVPFRVLLVIPPLLPGERHEMQKALSTINIVKRGTVTTGSLITLATVVPLMVLLVVVFAVVQLILRLLWYRTARTAEVHRKDSSAMDISAATVVDEPTAQSTATGRPSLNTTVVVWIAGVLRTPLGATLDKNGVTQSADEAIEAFYGVGAETSTGFGARSAHQVKGRRGGTGKVARQLFLLPSYDVLLGTSSSAQARSATRVATFLPQPRDGGTSVSRVTDPRLSLEADRQRYVDEWRIGTRAMALLTQRGVSAAVKLTSATKDMGGVSHLLTSSMLHATPSVFSQTSRIAEGRAGGRLGAGLDHSSPLSPWYRGAPESVSPSQGRVPSEAERSRCGGEDTTSPAPHSPAFAEAASAQATVAECVIPVGLSPGSFSARDTPLHAQPAHNNSSSSGSGIHPVASTATPCLVRPLSGSSSRTAPSNAADAASSLQSPGAMPVAIQSILTTSILAGVSFAYPSPLMHVPGTAPGVRARDGADPAFNASASGAAGGPVLGGTASAAFGGTSSIPSDDVTLVLRGRGNILFTTPDADLEATRALRGAASAAMAPSPRSSADEISSVFDSAN